MSHQTELSFNSIQLFYWDTREMSDKHEQIRETRKEEGPHLSCSSFLLGVVHRQKHRIVKTPEEYI